MKIKSFKTCLSFLPAIIMMAVIFFFSSRESKISTDESMLISYYIVDVGNSLGLSEYSSLEDREEKAAAIDGYVRKTAHMTEFGTLAFTVWFGLLFWTDSKKRLYTLSAVISVIYACTDEFHQLFVSGRAGKFSDVLVDSAGIFIVLAFIFLMEKLVGRSRYMMRNMK